jgi:hypothetical protein
LSNIPSFGGDRGVVSCQSQKSQFRQFAPQPNLANLANLEKNRGSDRRVAKKNEIQKKLLPLYCHYIYDVRCNDLIMTAVFENQ